MLKKSFRKIIHLDLDAFFCAVEQLRDPSLKGKPFAVGGSPTGRGVVTSASYAARRIGVRSAMPMSRAVRLCPQLIVVSSKYSHYTSKSKEVRQIMEEFTTLVQPISIDEAFLDFSEFGKPGEYYARKLQKRIFHETNLPCSLGVATNKLVAKIATNVGKAAHPTDTYPNAIQVVPPGEEAAFLAPLPTEALWGVGPKTAERFSQLGIETIGDIASMPLGDLINKFGKVGANLSKRARGIDERTISTSREAKSISHESTFPRDVIDEKILKEKILSHSQSIGRRLHKSGLAGITVKLKLRWSDFTTLTRQITLLNSTDDEKIIYDSAITLLRKHWNQGKPVRLIGVGVTNFLPPPRQMSLWDSVQNDNNRQLETAIEELRKRYGTHSIGRGKGYDTRTRRSGS